MTDFFNSGLSQQQFLQQYWQQKPLLIRNAFAFPVVELSADELAGYACEPDIESRLIRQLSTNDWQLQHGPFSSDVFAQLPENAWTLLVQDMDKHRPDLQSLWKNFDFIADWRRDDIMISYAAPGGSVGAHIDNYDVFLLQAQGTRRWQISDTPIKEPVWLADCDLRILAEFSANQSWDLQPGDMLYLPPGFAHHGVAQTPCMTLSFGFRAPAMQHLLESFLDVLSENAVTEQLFTDPGAQPANQPAEITADNIAAIKAFLHQAIDTNSQWLAQAIGRCLTESKPALQPWLPEPGSDVQTSELSAANSLTQIFASGDSLVKNPYIRFAWQQNDKNVLLYFDDNQEVLPCSVLPALLLLMEKPVLTVDDWPKIAAQPDLIKLLKSGLHQGYWQRIN